MTDSNLSRDERNLEKEKMAFERAILEPISEIPTDFDEDATSLLVDDIVSGSVFALGEMHGVRENPNVIYTLIKKFGFRQLGLEWDKELQRVVDLFQNENALDYNTIMNSCDGRITASYFNMLKRVKSEGLVDSIFFFDDKDSWNKRDEVMAEEIIGKTANGVPTMVVAGSAHADLRDIREGDGTLHPSMVKFLQNKGKNFSLGEIHYLSGQFFNNQVKEFKFVDGANEKKAKFYKNESGAYIYDLPVATVAVVPNPTGIYIG
ncbi:MAG: hypothetical protein ABL917_03010 [Parcubacteria group bacterium]